MKHGKHRKNHSQNVLFLLPQKQWSLVEKCIYLNLSNFLFFCSFSDSITRAFALIRMSQLGINR